MAAGAAQADFILSNDEELNDKQENEQRRYLSSHILPSGLRPRARRAIRQMASLNHLSRYA